MRFFLTILILQGFSGLGHCTLAQENNIERVILITPSNCSLLNQHVPDADVDYMPGLDARGNRVAPADLENRSGLGLGANGNSFYMTHDALRENSIANQFGLSDAQEGKIILGQVTVRDGDVLWNGTSLKEADRKQIYMLCEEQAGEKRRPIIKR